MHAAEAGRTANAAALAACMEAEIASRTAAAAFDLLDGVGVPVEISDPAAASTWYDDPDNIRNGLVADYHHPTYGRFRQFGHLVHLSDTPGRIAGPTPLLGEHSVQVLEQLGYERAEIDHLGEIGVTTWPSAPRDSLGG